MKKIIDAMNKEIEILNKQTQNNDDKHAAKRVKDSILDTQTNSLNELI